MHLRVCALYNINSQLILFTISVNCNYMNMCNYMCISFWTYQCQVVLFFFFLFVKGLRVVRFANQFYTAVLCTCTVLVCILYLL